MIFKKNEIKENFIKAGWYPNRNVETEINIPIDKFDYPKFLLEFLYEFGNLKVSGTTEPVAMEIHIEAASGGIDVEVEDSEFQYYAKKTNRTFFPIGYENVDAYFVVADNVGRVYQLGDYCYCRGKNLEDGIQNILESKWDTSLTLDEESGKWWNRKGEYVELEEWSK